MHDQSRLEKIIDVVRPTVESLGLTLWGVEFTPAGKRSVLRVFIEHPEGVDIEHCATVSRHLSLVLDVEDVVPGGYNLEVSSPGLDRRFFTLEQAAGYVGSRISVQLFQPLDGRRNFQGVLQAVQEDRITLIVDGKPVELPWPDVKQARCAPDFDNVQSPKGGGREKAPRR